MEVFVPEDADVSDDAMIAAYAAGARSVSVRHPVWPTGEMERFAFLQGRAAVLGVQSDEDEIGDPA